MLVNPERLDTAITATMHQARIPGLALAVVEGDAVTYDVIRGVEDTHRRPLLTYTTLFQGASLSKPVFAYRVLQLVDAGRLALDVPLSTYWRDPTIDDPRLPQITARHVLSHTTGFPNWRTDARLTTQWEPGARFGYSGEGYEYLQRVVEHVTATPLHEDLYAHVLAPLGMRSSTFAWGVDAAGEYLLDADDQVVSTADRVASSAAFSLLTTAHEYIQFVRAMVHAGSLAAAPYVSATSLREMLTPQVQVGPWPALTWGLGWGLQHTAWGTAFWHWGGAQNGYMNYVIGFPRQRIGAVILTNSEQGLTVCAELVEAALGEPLAQPAFRWLLPFDAWTATPE